MTAQEQINKFMNSSMILTYRPEWMDFEVYKLLRENEKKAYKIMRKGKKVK